MTTRSRRRAHFLLAATLFVGFTASSIVASPAVAEESTSCPAEALTESAALAAAASCGGRVEVSRLRDNAIRVWANPSGNLTSEQYASPQWVEKDDVWVDVDPSLQLGADGVVRPAAALSGLELSGGGDTDLVSAAAGDGRFGLDWSGTLPTPTVAGDIATYPEVLPGVDLQVQSQVEGFSFVLVVKTPEAAANPNLARVTLGTEVDGGLRMAQDSTGAIRLIDQAGQMVGVAPAATMWDSAAASQKRAASAGEPEPAAPGQFTEIPVELNDGSMSVLPDMDMLTSDSTTFPVYIDPSYSSGTGKWLMWAPVHREHPNTTWWNDAAWPRDDTMFVGNNGWSSDNSTGVWRSMVKINLSNFTEANIVDARYKVILDHSGSCTDSPIDIWLTGAINKGTTTSWNSTSSKWAAKLGSTSGHANEGGGCSGTVQPNEWLEFKGSTLTAKVQQYVSTPYSSMTFGFRAPDEGDKYQWKRLGKTSSVLEVDYNYLPGQPTNLSVYTYGACEGEPLWVSTRTPRLDAVIHDEDGASGTRAEVYKGTTKVDSRDYPATSDGKGGLKFNWRLTTPLADGSYKWRVQGYNGTVNSPWSPYCPFNIDATPPTVTPTITPLTAAPQAGVPAMFELGANGATDVVRYAYGIDKDAPEREIEAVDGLARITVEAPTLGGNTIYVWSKDAAGNMSARSERTFYTTTPPAAPYAGGWRLDGGSFADDNADSDELRHDLTEGAGWSATSDRNNAASAAAATNGTSCAKGEGTVLRTDQSFTVSAWVKLTATGGEHRTVLSQSTSTGLPGFYLKYHKSHNKWAFEIPYEADGAVAWNQVLSASAPALNTWTHLAGVYDQADGVIRLYVNGNLQGQVARVSPSHSDGNFVVGCSLDGATGLTSGMLVGAVDDVGAWQGVLGLDQIREAAGNLPPPYAGGWLLDGDGSDATGRGNDLTVLGDAGFAADEYGTDPGALQVAGSGYARTDNAIVRTDQSFTITARVSLDNLNADQVVVAQKSAQGHGFVLKFDVASQRWVFTMAKTDAATAIQDTVASNAAPAAMTWTDLVVVFDASTKQMRLYVDGVRQQAVVEHSGAWHSNGPLLLGASLDAGGAAQFGTTGFIDNVIAWRGVLTDQAIADLAA